MMAGKGGRKRRRRTSGALTITVTAALMLLAVILGLSVFFKVSQVNISGVSMYSAQQVRQEAGIELDSSIFFISESATAAKIKEALAYVDEVRITRKLPGTVVIDITERYPVANIESAGSIWVIDKNAKILDKKPSGSNDSSIPVYGTAPIMPAVGDILALGDAGIVQLTYLKQVLAGLLEADMNGDVQWIDMTNIGSITFRYLDRFTVNLGKGDAIEDKLWMLSKIAEAHPGTETGKIDLSEEVVGHFIPD